MKIFISIAPLTEFGDYKVVSPMNGNDPFNLECNDNECTEIIADHILDYIPVSKCHAVLSHYISKLRHGGKIILGGVDLVEANKIAFTGVFDPIAFNELLFGKQQYAWDFKRGIYSVSLITEYLQSQGLKVTKKRLTPTQFVIEAIRP